MAISQKAKEILNRPDLIARRDLWYERLQNVFDSTPSSWNQENTFGIMGIWGTSSYDPLTEPELWMEDCLENLAERYTVIENDLYFRPLCIDLSVFYVTHYLDKMLGAEVFYQDDQWYSHYLTTPIGQLKMPDLEQNEVWSLTKRAIQAFLDAEVALPTLSLPAIASPLNVAVNLYGGEILMELISDPDNAMKDLNVITDLQCQLHSLCRAMVPPRQLQPTCCDGRSQPPEYGQLCGCTTQLLSGPLYEELIAPLDERLLSVYPNGGMIHLCGSHTQHIETFRNMKSLKSIQINDRASQDLKEYYDGLREDQIIYFCPCDEVSVEQAMEITNGNRLVLVGNLAFPFHRQTGK